MIAFTVANEKPEKSRRFLKFRIYIYIYTYGRIATTSRIKMLTNAYRRRVYDFLHEFRLNFKIEIAILPRVKLKVENEGGRERN